MKVADLKLQLREAGVRPSRRLGQHFLLRDDLARRIAGFADLQPDDTVLEVGPGLGILTRALLERTRRVIAVEKDARLAAYLQEHVPEVQVIVGDVLRVPVPPFDKVVSNLPYEISSPFTFQLLGLEFKRAILTYQREFAQRLVASPGTRDYSRLTLKALYRCDREILERVPRSAFWPRPAVESAVVRLEPRPPPFDVPPEVFDRVVDVLFTHRRKRVLNALLVGASHLGLATEEVRNLVEPTEYATRRPQELDPREVAELANLLHPRKVNGRAST